MIKDIRVVQVWNILANGEQEPAQHFFELQREGSDEWEPLKIVNALGQDFQKEAGTAEDAQ